MSKHTPGPWILRLNDAGGFYVYVESGVAAPWASVVAIGDQWGLNAGQGHANARLISAAPDLLAALQSAADSLAQMALDRNDQELADLALNLRAAARGAEE